MLLYSENPKDCTKNVRTNKKVRKIVGYKVYIYYSFAILCTNNKLSEREIEKEISFYLYQREKILSNKFK